MNILPLSIDEKNYHFFIISKDIQKFSNYCDKEKLNGLKTFWCQTIKEAKFLSENHRRNNFKTKIINLK